MSSAETTTARPGRRAAAGGEAARRWVQRNRVPLMIALGSRAAVYLLIAAVGWTTRMRSVHGYTYRGFFSPLSLWDSQWYEWVARYGYDPLIGHGNTVAFFPAFPLAWRALLWLPGPATLWASLFNSACFVLAVVVIHRFTGRRYGEEMARATTLLICVFPLSFVYSLAYAESLFLLATALAFDLLDRGRVAGSLGYAVLATLTRPVGVFLAPVYWIAIGRRRGYRSPAAIAAGLVPVACYGAVVAYMSWRTGTLGATGAAEHRGWGREITFPLTFVIGQLHAEVLHNHHLRVLTDAAFVVLWVVLLFMLWRMRAGLEYVAYSALSVVVPIADGSMLSTARLGMIAFPLFWPAAAFVVRSQARMQAVVIASAMLLGAFAFMALGVQGYVP